MRGHIGMKKNPQNRDAERNEKEKKKFWQKEEMKESISTN